MNINKYSFLFTGTTAETHKINIWLHVILSTTKKTDAMLCPDALSHQTLHYAQNNRLSTHI